MEVSDLQFRIARERRFRQVFEVRLQKWETPTGGTVGVHQRT
jgi:hypothetical protein